MAAAGGVLVMQRHQRWWVLVLELKVWVIVGVGGELKGWNVETMGWIVAGVGES